MGFDRAEEHGRRLVASVGRFPVHRDDAVTADGRPPVFGDVFKSGISRGVADRRRRRRCDSRYRVEEFPIGKHLRPDARIDDVSAVLKKLPVNVPGDGCACPRDIDSGGYGWGLGKGRSGWETEGWKKQAMKK